MELLILFTGGTIGSAVQDGYIGLENDRPYALLTYYQERFGIDFDYRTASPYRILSENSTGAELPALVACIREHITTETDGVIVCHGTDTLPYTAAALGYAMGSGSIPVCLVSSDYPPADPRANGLENLHAAVQFLRQRAGRGCFVMYRGPGQSRTAVHRAGRLLDALACSAQVHSLMDIPYGYVYDDGTFAPCTAYAARPDTHAPFFPAALDASCPQILRLASCPGMAWPTVGEDVRHVLLGCYHSGTVNTADPAAQAFYREMQRRGIRVWLTGILPGLSYESTRLYESLGLTPLYGLAPPAAFVKLRLALACGLDPDAVLLQSVGEDIVPPVA